MSQLVPSVAVTLGGRVRSFRCTMNTLALVKRETGENLLVVMQRDQEKLIPLRMAVEAARAEGEAAAIAAAEKALEAAGMDSALLDPIILRAVVCGLLQHEKPAPTVEQVGEMIDFLDTDLIAKVGEAFQLFASGGRPAEADAPANPSTAAL